MKKSFIKLLIIFLFFLFSSFIFINNFCKIKKIEVTGIEIIPISFFENIPITDNNLFSVDRDVIADYLKKIDTIESFNIKRVLFNTLVIEVKEKNILAIINNNDNFFYITSKFELIRRKSGFNDNFLPVIEIEKKISYERLIGILKGLNLIKNFNKNFFNQIEKISLKENQNTYIFIRNKMYFLLNSIPTELDFLKVFTLCKIFNSGKFDLRGYYILNI
ncbi:MAG TPA: FtsQ-type POTRA domain-containing protein [Spirochaetota bacterium]|nr:FtsQ-type POTRA domain-containing protein [Spirochaetota bacterium]HOM39030.1 FtsQ-type POTRA domain-containing protein [Spirochaetota bacterium]HPQ49917.1 FtsQ-type POTRA domain-containing protein [Spirochaetota bacterium]